MSLEMTDTRWGRYDLQRLQVGVLERATSATEGELELALSRITRVDYRTISIVGFEHTLLGAYSQTHP